jgi:hypothetical protein
MDRTGETEGAGAYGAVDPRAAVEELRASLRTLLATLLDRAFGIALERVEDLARWLDEVAAHGGVRLNALLGGARAAIGGRSPVWGAIVGAVRGHEPCGPGRADRGARAGGAPAAGDGRPAAAVPDRRGGRGRGPCVRRVSAPATNADDCERRMLRTA